MDARQEAGKNREEQWAKKFEENFGENASFYFAEKAVYNQIIEPEKYKITFKGDPVEYRHCNGIIGSFTLEYTLEAYNPSIEKFEKVRTPKYLACSTSQIREEKLSAVSKRLSEAKDEYERNKEEGLKRLYEFSLSKFDELNETIYEEILDAGEQPEDTRSEKSAKANVKLLLTVADELDLTFGESYTYRSGTHTITTINAAEIAEIQAELREEQQNTQEQPRQVLTSPTTPNPANEEAANVPAITTT